MDLFAVLFAEEVQADADSPHQTGMCPSFHTSLSGFAEAYRKAERVRRASAVVRPESAARIGLIPEELSDRVTVLGNAAGSGALRYATEEGAAESALGIIRRTRYIELSAHAGFTDAYVERMLFPERE